MCDKLLFSLMIHLINFLGTETFYSTVDKAVCCR